MIKYITATPGIMSGDPVIAGIRIPIARIILPIKPRLHPQALYDDYPWVQLSVMKEVIDELVEFVTNSLDVTKVSQLLLL